MADFNGAACGGDVATDSIWAAAGDIVYATADDTATVLSKGCNSDILQLSSGIPDWTCAPSLAGVTLSGDITTTATNIDWDLYDNQTSALSFDSTGKTGIINIVTTDCSEGVTMSGTLGVTGVLTANAGVVVDNFTLDGTELDLSTGDFALDVAGDVEINADGGCINFKDASLALAAIVNTSCVGELRIHEAANYIGLKPPALSANQTWTWPATKGSCGEVLTCDGCGVLSWASAGGGVVSGGTDNAILRADGTGGSTSQGSAVILTDNNQFQAGNGCATTPTYSFSSNTNLGIYRAACGVIGVAVAGTERFRLTSGHLFIQDTANGDVSSGVTLQQADADDQIFALKSSDVAVGVTTVAETDTYFAIKKRCGGAGGPQIIGLSEGTYGMELKAVASTDCTTHSANGAGNFYLSAFKANGTGVQANAANANVFVVADNTLTKFIVDLEGDIFYDGSAAAFDTYCDAQLTRALATTMQEATCKPTQVVRNQWDDFVTYNEQTLLDLGILGDRVVGVDPSHRGLVNLTQLQRLHNSAIWQLHSKLNDQQEEILALKGQFHALTGGK